jgi:membrane-anchored glycerophosphoryl diester phosphodiesterase (GDPDase)
VYFGRDEVRVYRFFSDVLQAVSGTRERNWLFRLIELVGIGGVIALFLVLVFSVLLSALAFVNRDNSTILEVIKLSFTLILGFFFGSQTANKKAS